MNISKGYKLVPVEPTVAMEDAAAPECGGYCPRCDEDMRIKTGMQVDIYRTMLAAAPTPPQPIYDEAKELELFEIYALTHYRLQELPLEFEDGEYIEPEVQYSWEAWEARAKSWEVGHE